MRLHQQILGLPSSLLLLIASSTTGSEISGDTLSLTAQWPYNLPPHARYWPEDPPNRRRDLEAVEAHLRLGRNPVGVLKMGDDAGEKFYMEYWQFEGELGGSHPPKHQLDILRPRDEDEEARILLNASMPINYRPAFALHAEQSPDLVEYQDLRARSWKSSRDAAGALAILKRQGFACPSGTSSCSGINYPDICCADGETCYAIEDTGLGPVGCCPNGGTCAGSVNFCPSPNTACADGQNAGYEGGGCCIADYVCAGVGCTLDPNLVVTVVTTQVVVETASFSTSTTTEVNTVTSTHLTNTDTALQTTLACTSGFHACPLNFGRGCCTSGRTCGSFSMCLTSSGSTTSSSLTSEASSTSNSSSTSTSDTSATGVAPIRPTSMTTDTAKVSGTSCPIGFYACSAVFNGGCCQTGRSCDTTNCPATSSTTIISSGVTIAVPVGSAATVATPSGPCASGWSTCAQSVGGNCCPSGWGCGTASCSSIGPSTTLVELRGSTKNAGMRLESGMLLFFASRFCGILLILF